VLLRRIDIPLLFGLWTLFVWGGRLRNLNTDPGGFAEASRWSLVGSVLFTILGLAVVGAAILRRVRAGSRMTSVAASTALTALAALTVTVWVVRAVDIAIGDHSVGFIAVHVVLAVVSIGLAILSVRAVRPGLAGKRSRSTEPGRAQVG